MVKKRTTRYELYYDPQCGMYNIERLSDNTLSDWFDMASGEHLENLSDDDYDAECDKDETFS